MKKTTLMLLVMLLCCVAAEGAQVEFTTIARTSTIVDGSSVGGVTDRINEVITDQAVFEGFWNSAYSGKKPIPEAPKIDFTSEMVIAVSPGPRPTGGYDVQIVKVEDTGTTLEVTVIVKKPPPDTFVIEVFTQPYRLVKLPKKDLPVVFTWVEE